VSAAGISASLRFLARLRRGSRKVAQKKTSETCCPGVFCLHHLANSRSMRRLISNALIAPSTNVSPIKLAGVAVRDKDCASSRSLAILSLKRSLSRQSVKVR